MATWNDSSPTPGKLAPPIKAGAASAVKGARRLLKQLFAGRQRDDRPLLAKQ
jgi:hypothetical protein